MHFHPHFDPTARARKRRRLFLAIIITLIVGTFVHHEVAAKFVELNTGAILYFIFFGAVEG